MTIQRAALRVPFMLAASVLFLASSGCKNKEREREGMPEGAAPAPSDAGAAPDSAAADDAMSVDLAVITITGVDIDTKLAALCDIPGSSVFFKYDSSNLGAEAKERLDRVATCATTGAAKGKDLLIVGHADPTGIDEYNKLLGMSRAASVSDYLRSKGVAGQRIEIQSKGEAGAPPDRWGYPLARRVTIRLAT